MRSLSRYQSQSLENLDAVEGTLSDLPEKEEKCNEESKAVHLPVQTRPLPAVSEAQLDKELMAISDNSKALASFADQLAPVLAEHEETLLKVMDALPQLEAAFRGAQVSLQTI